MQVTGIGWAGVLTENFESSLRFFSQVLGLSLAHCDHRKELAHFRFRSGQLLEIYGPSNRRRKEKYRWFHGPVLGFEVNDIQSAWQEMIARGVRFITELESWEGDQWALFLGPEEKLFEILRPARSPARDFRNILGICQAKFLVQDFAGTLQFFSQIMEMSFAQQDESGIARCRFPTESLFEILGPSPKPWNQIYQVIVGFEVDDMKQARQEMESAGIGFVGPTELTSEGRFQSQISAPDGLIYELVYDPKPTA
jgi:predicted enzyme related to lactoylglutathione lyase